MSIMVIHHTSNTVIRLLISATLSACCKESKNVIRMKCYLTGKEKSQYNATAKNRVHLYLPVSNWKCYQQPPVYNTMQCLLVCLIVIITTVISSTNYSIICHCHSVHPRHSLQCKNESCDNFATWPCQFVYNSVKCPMNILNTLVTLVNWQHCWHYQWVLFVTVTDPITLLSVLFFVNCWYYIVWNAWVILQKFCLLVKLVKVFFFFL